jgi:hypothetical protein
MASSFSTEQETKPLGAPVRPRERHLYGAAPTGVVIGLIVLVLPLATWLLASGRILDGVVLLLVALVLAGLYAADAHQELTHGRLTRGAYGFARTSRDHAVHARDAAAAWSEAGVELAHLYPTRKHLERRMSVLIKELGEATYLGDHSLAELIKAEAHATEAQIAETDNARERVITAARERAAHTGQAA